MSWRGAVLFSQKDRGTDDNMVAAVSLEEGQLATFSHDHVVQNCNTQDM